MAAQPTFGTGATEIDIGQPGGTRATATPVDAFHPANVHMVQPDVAEVTNAFPQQSFILKDVLGWHGQTVQWRGNLHARTIAIYNSIVSELSAAWTGQTITAGVRSAVDVDAMAPRVLIDSFGTTISTRAKLIQVGFGNGRAPSNSVFAIIIPLTLTFQMLE